MKRVLIVDDDPIIVEGLRAYFELEEIDTEGAHDRDSAESLMAEHFFPIVLADLRLKCNEEGIRLLESIRRISPETRIASMTGANDIAEAELLALGARVVLRKPFPAAEVVAIVREMLAEIERIDAELSIDATADIEEVYATATRVLYSIPMRRYGLSREDAEELVQQTWCLYLERRESIRAPRAWLAGTVVNLCRREIQERYRERDREAQLVVTPEAYEEAHETTMIVRQALSMLDDKSRRLCELIGLERRSYEEVSDAMSIPVGSVGPMYIRAKEKLKAVLTLN